MGYACVEEAWTRRLDPDSGKRFLERGEVTAEIEDGVLHVHDEETYYPSGCYKLPLEDLRWLFGAGDAPGWIPCSERMPEIDARVLFVVTPNAASTAKKTFHVDMPRVRVGDFHLLGEWMDGELWGRVRYCWPAASVTHWRPLPELPPEVL